MQQFFSKSVKSVLAATALFMPPVCRAEVAEASAINMQDSPARLAGNEAQRPTEQQAALTPETLAQVRGLTQRYLGILLDNNLMSRDEANTIMNAANNYPVYQKEFERAVGKYMQVSKAFSDTLMDQAIRTEISANRFLLGSGTAVAASLLLLLCSTFRKSREGCLTPIKTSCATAVLLASGSFLLNGKLKDRNAAIDRLGSAGQMELATDFAVRLAKEQIQSQETAHGL